MTIARILAWAWWARRHEATYVRPGHRIGCVECCRQAGAMAAREMR